MSTETQEREIPLAIEEVTKEAKRLSENCLHTSKSHFVAARVWDNIHLWIGIPTVILAGIAGTLAFSDQSYISGYIAFVIVILTAITTFLNPKMRSNAHLTAGNNYDALLTEARIFWTIECKTESSDALLTDKIKQLTSERNRLNRESSQPPKWAYNVAKRGIKAGESDYVIDKKDDDTVNKKII